MSLGVNHEIPMVSTESSSGNSKLALEYEDATVAEIANQNLAFLSTTTGITSQDATRASPTRSSFVKWWLFEILATILSLASVVALIVVLQHYNGRALQDINLPSNLTINSVIAAISTVTAVALMVPVGAGISQDAWLCFSDPKQKRQRRSPLNSVEVVDSASRGAMGSLRLLFAAPKR
jgi:hypothetical protein